MVHTYLALDIGEKRIGLAVGSVLPFGRGYITVSTISVAIDQIKEIVQKEGVTAFVFGMPRTASGEVTPFMRWVKDFVDELRQHVPLPATEVDETLTSVEAERQLRAEGVDITKEKGRIDERAAMLILEQHFAQTSIKN